MTQSLNKPFTLHLSNVRGRKTNTSYPYEAPITCPADLMKAAKFDHTAGLFKTRFFAVIALKADWFSEGVSINTDNKDTIIQADDKCIGHQIPEKLLKALIMDQLHLLIVQLSDKRKVLEELQKIEDVQNPVYRAKGEIMSLTDKVSQMAKKREQLYADYVAGVVDSEDYQLIREDYSRQYDGLRAALQEAESKKTEVERQIEEYLNMTSHLEEHLDNFEFDIQLLKSLVQKIEVSADKRIRIVFGFQDVFTELGKESAEI